jgi:hypothetical protein
MVEVMVLLATDTKIVRLDYAQVCRPMGHPSVLVRTTHRLMTNPILFDTHAVPNPSSADK